MTSTSIVSPSVTPIRSSATSIVLRRSESGTSLVTVSASDGSTVSNCIVSAHRESLLKQDKSQLVDALCLKTEYISSLLLEISTLKKQKSSNGRSLKRKLDRRDAALIRYHDEAEAADDCLWIVHRKSNSVTGHLAIQAQLSLAVRRNIGNIAAKDMSKSIMQDISRQTIVRAELLCGGCIVAAFEDHHRVEEAKLEFVSRSIVSSGAPVVVSAVAAHVFSCDATVSNVWRNSKLMSCNLLSAYLTSCESLSAAEPRYDENASCMAGWADLQQIVDSTMVFWTCSCVVA